MDYDLKFKNKVPYPENGNRDKAGIQAYREGQSQSIREFEQHMESEYGMNLFGTETRRMIHAFAWSEGHAHGFSEVANFYPEIVEIALSAIKEHSK